MSPSRRKSSGESHRFGGDWTAEKLEIIARYLAEYTKVLKNQPFKTAYIDAFAGTGYVDQTDDQGSLLFPDLAASEPQRLIEGSAVRALKTEPSFDRYIFIERNEERCAQLESLRQKYPERAANILIQHGDANMQIRDLCRRDWKQHRAVLFLDPYGMQVEWPTIEAIASTRAIDLWILFPLGIGVSRLLTRSGDIPAEWRRRLDLLLGTTDWYDEFYRVEHQSNLFGEQERIVTKASTDVIGRYFNDRLKTVFAGVAPQPRVLANSRNCPLYLLCFAVGNPRGVGPALRIAGHLLGKDKL